MSESYEPKPPANLNRRWPRCPECGGDVYPVEIDYCVKKCDGWSHIIGLNDQLWIPGVYKFCYVYGFNKEDIERKRVQNELYSKEVLDA